VSSTSIDWDAFEAWCLLEGAKSGKGLAPITVGRRIRRLKRLVREGYELDQDLETEGRRALGDAAKREDAPSTHRNWVKALNTLARYELGEDVFEYRKKEPKRDARPLTEDEVSRLKDVRWEHDYKNYIGRAAVHLSLYIGVRRSEFAAIELDHLDPPGEGDRFGAIYIAEPAKDGKCRWLPLEKELFSPKRPFGAYLNNHLEDPDDPDALWVRPPRNFVSSETEPVRASATYLYDLIKEAGEKAGCHYNFNRSRHTALTRLRRENPHVDRDFIQAWAGHQSSKSADTYLEITHRDLEDRLKLRPRSDIYADSE
jgi:site-specific recombinase XerD